MKTKKLENITEKVDESIPKTPQEPDQPPASGETGNAGQTGEVEELTPPASEEFGKKAQNDASLETAIKVLESKEGVI